jgi:hypothetical protein
MIRVLNFFFISRTAGEERKNLKFKPYLIFNLTYSQEIDSENNRYETKIIYEIKIMTYSFIKVGCIISRRLTLSYHSVCTYLELKSINRLEL